MLGFLRGKGGELRAGYQCAAKLGAWAARKGSDGYWHVDAQPLDVNAHWIKYKPLDMTLVVGGRRWSWSGVDVLQPGGLLIITTKGEPKK